MAEKLIAGHTACTDVDEYSADALSEAPATAETVSFTVSIATVATSVSTYENGC